MRPSKYQDRRIEASREVTELALAHVNNDPVEVADRRTNLFERHRTLIWQWAE